MADEYLWLAEQILNAVRGEVARHLVTGRGSQSTMRCAIANVLRKHRFIPQPQPREED